MYRRDKSRYTVSPLSTVFSNDNYYLMCYDERHDGIGYYRIDRMEDVQITDDPIAENEKVKSFDLSRHKRQLFGIFNGEDARVTFQTEKTLVYHIFDRFGDDVEISYGEGGTAVFTANVQVSAPFLGWCCSFGKMLKVVSPLSVAKQIKNYASEVVKQYD